ncbi:MAG: hypothetical protein JXR94_15665 [Candidatus Hydrogenedentes bacterium]|nr:hypothetical protein [Candidatus Hydrogenedentota bacterium]
MSALLTAALVVCAGAGAAAPADGLEVVLAPDQPIPHVYVDDPLIVEFSSPADLAFEAHAEILHNGEAVASVDLGAIALRAHSAHWLPIADVPERRGLYEIRFELAPAGGPAFERTGRFCRVDRPGGASGGPAGLSLAAITPHMFQVARGLPLNRVRVRADAPNLASCAEEGWPKGVKLAVYLPVDELDDAPALAESLSAGLDDWIARWDVDAGGEAARLESIAKAIARGGSRAPIALVVDDAEALAAALSAGAGRYASAIAFRPGAAAPSGTIEAVRAVAEGAGYEGMRLVVVPEPGQGGEPGPARTGAELVRDVVVNAAAGAVRTEVDSAFVFDEGRFQDGFVTLSALGRQLNGAVYAGALGLEEPAEAYVFRTGTTWVMVLWRAGSAGPLELELELGGATDLALSDMDNNPLDAPGGNGGAVAVAAGPEPCYLTGAGGDVLARAASTMACVEAQGILGSDALREALPPELIDVLNAIAAPDAEKPDRLSFFALLRMFPELERGWAAGTVPAEVAVGAMARLARLVRHLCVLEEEAHEPFLEPLDKTLAKCDGYKSQYLTSSGGPTGALARGDWLLGEVTRLMQEAQSLMKQGRAIEANGVAALAEWRARALDVRRAMGG